MVSSDILAFILCKRSSGCGAESPPPINPKINPKVDEIQLGSLNIRYTNFEQVRFGG